LIQKQNFLKNLNSTKAKKKLEITFVIFKMIKKSYRKNKEKEAKQCWKMKQNKTTKKSFNIKILKCWRMKQKKA
jgi:hypothetical protein